MSKNNQQFIKPLIPAEISWLDGQPYSLQFNDVYFSKVNGLEETRYVFLRHNDLPSRWNKDLNEDFVVAETGFGTGLNFLTTCQLWFEKEQSGILHFLSVDKHPLIKEDLERSLGLWPELFELSNELLRHYPELAPGWHRIILFEGKVLLTLFFGEVEEYLQSHSFKANAWFLDGFAPRNNESMWADTVCQCIAERSEADASFATYTAAGHVRRALQAAGFSIEKHPGFAHKRELISGRLNKVEKVDFKVKDKPWFMHTPAKHNTLAITIIGAGLAGAFTANVFARRGYQVTVIDEKPKVAQGASGNRQAMVYCRFSPFSSNQYDFYHQAYLYSLSYLKQYSAFKSSGLLDVMFDDKSLKRYKELQKSKAWPESLMEFVDKNRASHLAGVSIEREAIYMQGGGYVNPVQLCEDLLSHPKINLMLSMHVKSISYESKKWHLYDEKNTSMHESQLLVIANAYESLQFENAIELPLKTIRGQVTYLQQSELSKRLQVPVCHDGYIAPAEESVHCIGATYDMRDDTVKIKTQDDHENLTKLRLNMPDMYEQMQINENNVFDARVGFRCYTPDYLPVVGPLPDTCQFNNNYAPLRLGQLNKPFKQGKFTTGLFVNIAHGSRGVVSAPLSAELLFSYVHGKGIFPTNERVRHALHPARFLMKSIRQNK